MSKQLELMASVYTDEDGAKTILDTLEKMHLASNITMADAAMVTKDTNGRLQIKETREVPAGKGARRGAFITGFLGNLIYPPSLIVSVLAGGVIGGAWGSLEPGNAAVVALAEPQFVEPIMRAMEAYRAKFLRHGFSAEEAAQIEDAAAAGDANG